MSLIRNQPLLLLVAFLALGAVFLPFLSHAPNRLISGQPIMLVSLSAQNLGLLIMPGIVLIAGPFVRQSRGSLTAVALAALLWIAALFFVAGWEASRLSGAAAPSARTSFGSGFWLMLITGALILADTLVRAGHAAGPRLLGGLAASLPVAVLLSSGHLNDLSIMKEYANTADVFWQAVVRHIAIVGGALLPTLLLGVPLGVLASRRNHTGQGVLTALNVIQTIPSMALFGLLMAPLSALAFALPSLGAAGISGIGLAPAIIALTLYCLLPIVRNTSEGLQQTPRHVLEAARGMGLTDRQVFWQVEAPLALPVFLSGLRVTLVQAIGLAAVAALIGAGGLGSIMFKGLFSNALDLVLLGVAPIIVMAVVVDALFKVGTGWLNGTDR